MVLVDPRILDKISTPKDRAVYEAYTSMGDILNDDSLEDDIKAKLYASQFRRQQILQTPDTEVKFKTVESNKTLNEDLLAALPEALKEKAKTIYAHLARKSSAVFDNNDRLVIDGKIVENTNALDLIRSVLSGDSANRPPGWYQFVQALKDSNISQSILKLDSTDPATEKIKLPAPTDQPSRKIKSAKRRRTTQDREEEEDSFLAKLFESEIEQPKKRPIRTSNRRKTRKQEWSPYN
jgi:hypothetical protein